MVKGKPSVAEKREMARKVIQDAAMELFYTKGYDETTTRDIIAKAGILNGSLYNRFKNKDEILFSIVKDAIKDLLDSSKAILAEENNLLLAASFPGALQIYLASQSKHIADLLYKVHCMWSAVEEYVSINVEWSRTFLAEYGLDSLNEERFRVGLLTLIGALGDMVGYYAHGGNLPYRETMAHYVLLVATSLKMPLINLDAIVDSLIAHLSADDFIFMGHNLSEELPQLSKCNEEQ